MQETKWKSTPLIEDIGEVSNDGWFKYYNWHNTGKEKITKGNKQESGHYHVGFRKDGKPVNIGVHKLVAEAFVDNPENKSEVHHKDFNPANNNADNLMFVTRAEHMLLHKARQIEMLSMDWEHEEYFSSMKEATRELRKRGIMVSQGNISAICNGKRGLKSTHGHRFRFAKSNSIK